MNGPMVLQVKKNSASSFVRSCPDAVKSLSPSFVLSKKGNEINYPSLISPESQKKSSVVMPQKSSSYDNFIQAFHKIREETSQIGEIVLVHEATCVNQRLAQLQTNQKRLSINNSTPITIMEPSSAKRRKTSSTNSITDIPSKRKSIAVTYDDQEEESVIASMIPLTITTIPCFSIVSNDDSSNDNDDNDSLTTTSVCSEFDRYDDDDDISDDENDIGNTSTSGCNMQEQISKLQQISHYNQMTYEKNEILMKAFRMKKMANIFRQIQSLQDELLNEMKKESSL